MCTSSIPKNRKLSRYSTGDESDSPQHSKTMFSICPVIALGCPETGQCPSAVSPIYSDGKNPSIESESHLGLLVLLGHFAEMRISMRYSPIGWENSQLPVNDSAD